MLRPHSQSPLHGAKLQGVPGTGTEGRDEQGSWTLLVITEGDCIAERCSRQRHLGPQSEEGALVPG